MITLAMPDLTGNESRYLQNCITSTYVSSVGEYVNRFEEVVAAATGSTSAVATSSGTAGLHAALMAVGVSHDDLVILPTFTFIASANAVRYCGADPWLVDVSPVDWCLDPDIVREQIRRHCKRRDNQLIHRESGRKIAAIMPVYTLGAIPDMKAFRELSDEYGIPLVADAACAIGAAYRNQDFGSLADLSVLSFNGNKTITCGGGGAVVYSGLPKEVEKAEGKESGRRKRAQAWGEKVRHLTTTARVWPDYDFDEVGFNYRMTNIQAAVGVAQMERLSPFLERKKYVRAFYESSLEGLAGKGVTFFPTPDGCSCWFSGLVLPDGTQLGIIKDICSKLKEKGIEARPFWKPVHLQKPYAACLCSPGLREGKGTSNSLWQRILTLPCSTNITDEQLETVSGAVKALLTMLL